MRKHLLALLPLLLAVSSAPAQPLPPPVAGGAIGVAPYVATTAGAASVTGTTAETNLAALKIPANAIGKNGAVEIYALWSYTNSANNKTLSVRFTQASGATSGGLVGLALVATTTAAAQTLAVVRNNNATNAQVLHNVTGVNPFVAASATITLAVDTTQDSYLNLNAQLALGTETITLQHAYVVVYPHQ